MRGSAPSGLRSARGTEARRTYEGGSFGAEAFARLFAESPGKLSLELQHLAERHGASVLLFVDQLEELFSLTGDEAVRASFVEAICRAADDAGGPVRVIFTLRDDFLWRLAETDLGRETLQHVTVLRSPGPGMLEQTVRQPLLALGYDIDDPTLLGEMVAAVQDEPAALALLQFTAGLLWERRDTSKRLLLRSVYEELGGVGGALARHADQVLAGLAPDQLLAARALLLRLVTPEGTRRVPTREELLGGLGPEAPGVLDRLVQGRLLVVQQGPAGGSVEIVHESLVRGWERLRRWLDESREDVAFLAEASAAAELWQKRGCSEAEAWHGDALREARRWLARGAMQAPELVTRFIEAGAQAEQQQLRRRRRTRAAGMAALALLALIACAVALAFASKEREATSLQVRAETERQRAEQGQAAALREGARSALGRGDVLEARAKVRMALEAEDAAPARMLWWQMGQEPLLWRKLLGMSLSEVAWSPDGATVAGGGFDRAIYLFDARTAAVRILRGSEDSVTNVAWSSDGRLLAAGQISGQIDLWEPGQGSRVRKLAGHTGWVVVRFSRDGKLLASASDDQTVRLWDPATGAELAVLRGHAAPIQALAVSPDGRLLASGSMDGVVRVWDVAQRKELRVLRGHGNRVTAAAFSPDGSLLATGSGDRTVRLWDTASWEQRRSLPHDERVYSVVFGSDGLLVSGTTDGQIHVWDATRGTERERLTGHAAIVNGLSLSPDGSRLASAGADSSVRLWDLTVRAEPPLDRGHRGIVSSVAFGPDGRTLASGSHDSTVRLWSIPDGTPIRTLRGHAVAVMSLAQSPDGKLVASGSGDKTIRLWNPVTGVEQGRLEGHTSTVYFLAFSPDSRGLASSSTDGTVRTWDVAAGTARRVLSIPGRPHLAFSPDGRTLAVAGSTIRLLDPATGAELRSLTGPEDGDTRLAFAPDGRSLASGGAAGVVRLWDLATGRPAVLAKGLARLGAIAFAPGGERLGVATTDGTGQILDLRTHAALVLRGHRGEINALAFSPDGTLVATGSDDGTVRLWDARTGKPYWRGPLLLSSPPEAFTHRGWSDPATGLSHAPAGASRWRKAVEEQARSAAAAEQGSLLCLQTTDDRLEAWDRAADRRIGEEVLPGVNALLALPGGCVTLAQGTVRLHPMPGAARELATAASAMAWDHGELLVAAGGEIVVFDGAGARRATYPSTTGATALGRSHGRLVLGFADGNMELVPTSTDLPRVAVYFEEVPSSPVLRIVEGPMGTVAAGYGNGLIGLWSLENGARLDQVRLHGGVVHLRLEGGRLQAVTELGDVLVRDLSTLQLDYCDLLRTVWQGVALAWEDGLPVLRPPPAAHPCSRR